MKTEKKNIWQTANELMAEDKHGEALAMLVSEGIPEDHADFYIKHNGKTAKSDLKKISLLEEKDKVKIINQNGEKKYLYKSCTWFPGECDGAGCDPSGKCPNYKKEENW